MLPGTGWEQGFAKMRWLLVATLFTPIALLVSERAYGNPCEAALTVTPAAQARKALAMGARSDWTISDYDRASLAILPDGRQAWGQMARVLWDGDYGQQALTIRSFAFSESESPSPPGLFLKGSRFLKEFITATEELVQFVLDAYANRRAWPAEFLEQLWQMAYTYIDESTYISTAAGGLRDTIAVNPNLDRFLKPFEGQLQNVSTIRLAAERSGLTIMETLLNLKINSDSQTLKVEPGNLNILPIASEPAKAQLAVGILSTMDALKLKYRRSNLKFVTYTDERALPIYMALGFRKMRMEDFKKLPKDTYELDSQGFVTLKKRFKNGTVVNWTPLTCEESDLRTSARKFIDEFRQKYPTPELKSDLDQLVRSIELALRSAPISTRAIGVNSQDGKAYETKIFKLPSLGFQTRNGFRGLPNLPSLEEGEVYRIEVAENGQRHVGEFRLNDGILEYRVYPFYPFEAHDWMVSRRGQALSEESKPLWMLRMGSLQRSGSFSPSGWIEYSDFSPDGRPPSYMETAWVEKFEAVRLAGKPRLESLFFHFRTPPTN